MAGGRVVTMMATWVLIVSVNARVAARPAESTTRTVKADVPALVGVPLMTPVEALNDSPAGKLPVDTDHVNGARPPLTASVRL